jgi:peroxiredoxin
MKTKIIIASVIILLTSTFFYFKNSNKNDLKSYGYGFKSKIALSKAKGEIPNFSLLDHNGDFFELYRNFDKKAIVIISQGNDCPIIQKFSSVINDLKNKFESQNVLFLMINANIQDDRQSIIDEAKNYGISLPILMDHSQLVSESLGITRTSEAVVINPDGWKIIYRGAISDRLDYGADKQRAQNNYLNDFLESIIKNNPIATSAVPAKGCLITFNEPTSLSYEKVIAPIIMNKCLSCHGATGNFPPKFTSYEKIKSWVQMSRETILTERMPPFSADTYYGGFANDISLSPEEKRLLIKWIDAGAQKDSSVDPILSYVPIKKSLDKLNLFSPIYSASMEKPHPIPPGGEIEYQYFQLGGPVPFDMWTKGYLTTSTSPRQLHHESLFVVSKPLAFYEDLSKKKFNINEEERRKNTDGDVFLYTLTAMEKYETEKNPKLYTKFQVWGAGKNQPFFHTKYVGAYIPKGSYLVLETHYMGTGKEDSEQTTINFYGYKKKPVKMNEMHNLTLTNTNFEIPPMVNKFNVETKEWTSPGDMHIRSFLGHLHMRGRSVKVFMKTKNEEFKTILSIPNYYYGWQTGSALNPAEPILVPAGAVLKAVCTYDNSPQNPYNPDPNKVVHFGQRSDRTEMCKFNMGYTIDKK